MNNMWAVYQVFEGEALPEEMIFLTEDEEKAREQCRMRNARRPNMCEFVFVVREKPVFGLKAA